MIASGALPPHRVALLAPGARNEWYSASPLYAGALVRGVLPAVAAEVAVRGAPVAMGASLGALAMLHAQHRHPGTFAGLFLQSGSFFTPEHDIQERGFSRWARVTAFVAEVLAGGRGTARRRPSSPAAPARRTSTTTARWRRRSASRCTRSRTCTTTRPGADALHPHLTGLLEEPVVDARHAELYSPAIGAAGNVVVHGHWGRPFLAFPAERGNAWEYGDRGVVGALAALIDAGRAKLYCVDSFDGSSWSNSSIPLEERARAHERYESWILEQVVPWIHHDCGGPQEIATLGVSLGAFHAVNIALRRADVFPLALGFSGNYDPSTWDAWGEPRRRRLLQQPVRLARAHAAATTSTGCARA